METRQRAAHKRSGRAVLGERSKRASSPTEVDCESETVQTAARFHSPRRSEQKSACRGATPAPSREAKKSFGEAQSRSISAPRGRAVLGVDGVNRRPRNSVRLCDGGFIAEL